MDRTEAVQYRQWLTLGLVRDIFSGLTGGEIADNDILQRFSDLMVPQPPKIVHKFMRLPPPPSRLLKINENAVLHIAAVPTRLQGDGRNLNSSTGSTPAVNYIVLPYTHEKYREMIHRLQLNFSKSSILNLIGLLTCQTVSIHLYFKYILRRSDSL
jgi:hypothetical protein